MANVANISGCVQLQVTGADYIEQLKGMATEVGGSTTIPNVVIARAGGCVGVDAITGNYYNGMNINIGVGAGTGPGEVHANKGDTYVGVVHSGMNSDSSLDLPVTNIPISTVSPQPSSPQIYAQSYSMTQEAYNEAVFKTFSGVASGMISASSSSTLGMSNMQAYEAYQAGKITYADYSNVILKSIG